MVDNLIDIDLFADELAAATEQFCSHLFSKVGRDSVYGVALGAFDDLAGIYPKASTEAGFAERRDKLLSNEQQRAWLAERGIDLEKTILGDERWSPFEWEYGEAADMRFYAKANGLLESTVNSLADTEGPGSWRYFTAEVHASSALALKRLRDAGVFDRANGQITLFCSKHASSDAIWLERESARFLNTPEAYERFKRERIDWITDENSHDDIATAIFCEILALAAPAGKPAPRGRYEWWHRLEKEMAADRAKAEAPFSRKRPHTGPPCPQCGAPLRTPLARQCVACGAKWH
ncbi:MAG: DUF4303 domain-containing protein [Aureliella sp.]